MTRPLQVSPDPSAPAAATGPAGVPLDPGLAWLTDFDQATSAGMALTLSLDGGAAGPPPSGQDPGPAVISKVIVTGLQTPGIPDPAALLTGVLQAHRFTGGLEILPPGTATNNTAAGPSGYTSTDPMAAGSYAREITIPDGWAPPRTVTGDAARLAAALRVPGDTFATAGDVREDALAAQAVAAVTWRASWGTYLPWLGLGPVPLEAVRGWVSAWVKPGGPLPALRAGRQVYGVLPAMALDTFTDVTDTPVAPFVAELVRAYRPSWLAAAGAVLAGDFNAQLSRSPVSSGITARAGISGISSWLSPGQGLMGTASADLHPATSLMPQALPPPRADSGAAGPRSPGRRTSCSTRYPVTHHGRSPGTAYPLPQMIRGPTWPPCHSPGQRAQGSGPSRTACSPSS